MRNDEYGIAFALAVLCFDPRITRITRIMGRASIVGWALPTNRQNTFEKYGFDFMPDYRRVKYGRTYFFTVVTYKRKPILCIDESRAVLRKVLMALQGRHPFEIKAWVLLPDHIHCIWELPENDTDYSMRWGWLKKTFTQQIRKTGDRDFNRLVGTAHPTMSRERHREGTIWQRRFWEHMIRDDEDYRRHCDYIHFNPVKHGLVNSPIDWPYSTLHGFMEKNIYSKSWGREGFDFIENMGGE